MSNPKIFVAAIALALAACDVPSGPDSVVRLGAMDVLQEEPNVVVDNWQSSLRVEITTWGNSCTSYSHDDVDVDREARVVSIRPYDRHRLGFCQDIGVPVLHKVSVEPGPGDWLVRVIGGGPSSSYDPTPPELVFEVEAHIPILIDNPND